MLGGALDSLPYRNTLAIYFNTCPPNNLINFETFISTNEIFLKYSLFFLTIYFFNLEEIIFEIFEKKI